MLLPGNNAIFPPFFTRLGRVVLIVLLKFWLILRWLMFWSPGLLRLLIVAAVIYVVVKGWRRVTVISPFRVPADNRFPFDGQTVANVLCDCLTLVKRGDPSWLQEQTDAIVPTAKQLAVLANLKLQEFTDFELVPTFTVEVKGFSFEAVISLARKIFGRERTISGYALLNEDRILLVAQLDGKGPWEVERKSFSPDELKWACSDLALRILEDIDPTRAAAAAFEIATLRYQDAYGRLFRLTLERKSSRVAKHLLELAAELRARELWAEKEYDGALKLLDAADTCLPRSAPLASVRGLVLAARGRLDNGQVDMSRLDLAISSYKEALRLKPDDPEVLTYLGDALYARGLFLEAVVRYRKAVQLHPFEPQAHHKLSCALKRAGQEADSEREYAEAERLNHLLASAGSVEWLSKP